MMASLDTKLFPIQEYMIRNKWKETIAGFSVVLGQSHVACALHRLTPAVASAYAGGAALKDVICVATKQVAGARGSA